MMKIVNGLMPIQANHHLNHLKTAKITHILNPSLL